VIYKVIFKILARRLSHVLQDIIGRAQNAFLGGRNMIDSINLAQELLRHYGRKITSPSASSKLISRKLLIRCNRLFSDSFFICWAFQRDLSILLCCVWKPLLSLLLSMVASLVFSLRNVEFGKMILSHLIYF